MSAVMIQSEFEDIGTKIAADESLPQTYPVIGKMMPCLAEGGVR
jgi:hypothetical protein